MERDFAETRHHYTQMFRNPDWHEKTPEFVAPPNQTCLDVSLQVFDELADAHLAEESPEMQEVIKHGFQVIGRGINQCWKAYLAQAETEQKPGTEAGFMTALTSPQTISFFVDIAKMRDEKNGIYETWFQLNWDSPADVGPAPFSYDASESCFKPNALMNMMAEDEAIEWAINNNLPTDHNDAPPKQCVASPIIPIAWTMVANRCQAAGLFDSTKLRTEPAA